MPADDLDLFSLWLLGCRKGGGPQGPQISQGRQGPRVPRVSPHSPGWQDSKATDLSMISDEFAVRWVPLRTGEAAAITWYMTARRGRCEETAAWWVLMENDGHSMGLSDGKLLQVLAIYDFNWLWMSKSWKQHEANTGQHFCSSTTTMIAMLKLTSFGRIAMHWQSPRIWTKEFLSQSTHEKVNL